MKFTLLLILCILVTCYADDTNAKRNRRSGKSSGRGGSSRSGNSNSSGRGSSSGSGKSNSSGKSSSSGSGKSNTSGKSSSSGSGKSNSSGKSSSSGSGNSNSPGKSSSSGSGNSNSPGKSSSSGSSNSNSPGKSSSSNKPTGGISSNRSPGKSSSSSLSTNDLRTAAFADKESRNRVKNFSKNYYQGVKEMVKSYQEMRKANVIGSDKYFHAKGNFNAAKLGPGGVAAAEDISNLREATDKARYKISNILGKMSDSEYNEKIKDSKKDQEANAWGRSGEDPNKYRVNGIPNADSADWSRPLDIMQANRCHSVTTLRVRIPLSQSKTMESILKQKKVIYSRRQPID